MGETRKLAAILCSEVVGYSRRAARPLPPAQLKRYQWWGI
jgi:hypothetical protein